MMVHVTGEARRYWVLHGNMNANSSQTKTTLGKNHLGFRAAVQCRRLGKRFIRKHSLSDSAG